MRELVTIASTSITAGEAFGLRRSYYLSNPGPVGGRGDEVAVGLDDPGQKILKEIRARQGPGTLLLLRSKPK